MQTQRDGWICFLFFFLIVLARGYQSGYLGDGPPTGAESHGPRLQHNSDQCPASRNYCLLWLIIPPSFDRAMVPNGLEGG